MKLWVIYHEREREHISKSFVNDAKQESSSSILRNQQIPSGFDSKSFLKSGFVNDTVQRKMSLFRDDEGDCTQVQM